jgi:riboflavin synthase
MFTGIVAAVGSIRRLTRRHEDARLEIDTSLDLGDVRIGDSIAVSGACLTVTALGERGFAADVSAETLSRTTLKGSRAGERVNLEKALRVGDRLGGHLVLGHVDGVGTIRQKKAGPRSIVMVFEVDPGLSRYIASKGSIAVDGISLTVNSCEKDRFYVTLIPHTASETTLGWKKESDSVNIETDVIARYLEKLISAGKAPESEGGDTTGSSGGIDREMLARYGFLK